MSSNNRNDTEIPCLVALITDYGLSDSYISEMQAALLIMTPNIKILDITHYVPPGDVKAGAYLLWRASERMPNGTVYLAVVDPGVGSNRQAVAVACRKGYFVAPDNGLLSRVIPWDDTYQVRVLSLEDSPHRSVSPTFHGRDLFAPVAGKLARGDQFSEIGVEGRLRDTHRPEQPRKTPGGLSGEVVYIDRFGNINTNLPNRENGILSAGGLQRIERVESYSALSGSQVGWLPGSDGNIEIAAGNTSAADILEIEIGEEVKLGT